MMLSGAGVALRVITAPNSAFAQIRDNDGAYFVWSVCIFVFSSFLVITTVGHTVSKLPNIGERISGIWV